MLSKITIYNKDMIVKSKIGCWKAQEYVLCDVSEEGKTESIPDWEGAIVCMYEWRRVTFVSLSWSNNLGCGCELKGKFESGSKRDGDDKYLTTSPLYH